MTGEPRWTETKLYLSEVWALFRPGHAVPTTKVDSGEPGKMDDWDSDDLDLVIDECRRQLDAQLARLESVTSRAQLVLATNLTVVALLVAGLRTLVSDGGILAFLAWFVALVFVSISLLGSAAVIVVRKDFGTINAAVVSTLAPPIRRQLARAYTRTIGKGEQTIAREVTVSRDAVLLTLVGVLIYGAAWCLTVAT